MLTQSGNSHKGGHKGKKYFPNSISIARCCTALSTSTSLQHRASIVQEDQGQGRQVNVSAVDAVELIIQHVDFYVAQPPLLEVAGGELGFVKILRYDCVVAELPVIQRRSRSLRALRVAELHEHLSTANFPGLRDGDRRYRTKLLALLLDILLDVLRTPAT